MKSVKAYRGLVQRRRDGFIGERQIIIPQTVLKKVMNDPFLNNLYITEIGFFPKATFHYRERRCGWQDNILFYCLDGKGWYQNKNGYCDISANEFVILPATDKFIRFGADAKDPWTLCWLHFRSSRLDYFNKLFSIETYMKPTLLRPNGERMVLWEKMYNSLETGYDFDNLSFANFYLYHFISSFLQSDKDFKSGSPGKSVITDAIAYMRERVLSQISVSDIAKHFNYSTSHFSSLFRKQTGVSPIDYFIQMKMQKACQLLDLTDLKVKDIAYKLGYDSPYYFTRIFSSVIGRSPKEYRSAAKR